MCTTMHGLIVLWEYDGCVVGVSGGVDCAVIECIDVNDCIVSLCVRVLVSALWSGVLWMTCFVEHMYVYGYIRWNAFVAIF